MYASARLTSSIMSSYATRASSEKLNTPWWDSTMPLYWETSWVFTAPATCRASTKPGMM
jgi:hypothetical protein